MAETTAPALEYRAKKPFDDAPAVSIVVPKVAEPEKLLLTKAEPSDDALSSETGS
jgi:hypothetical protein